MRNVSINLVKAAVWKEKGRFEIEEVPIPAPARDEVLIKIEYCGVCGSDLHRAYTHGQVAPGVVIGHEYVGTVVEAGPEADMWKAGDRVLHASGEPRPAPGVRFTPRMLARTGFPGTLDQGGFAEYKRLRTADAARVPDSIDAFTASLVEPCAIAVHAIETAEIRLGERVGIIGLGPIGLLVFQVAKAAGAAGVYGVDPSPVRRRAALQLGIDAAIDSGENDAVETLVSLTGGGPDVLFECAAGLSTLDQALTAVRAHGRVVLVGISWDPVTINPVEWLGRGVELRTMYAYARRHCELAMKLVEAGKIGVGEMIREEWTFPLECIHPAFERSLEATLVKAVIRP